MKTTITTTVRIRHSETQINGFVGRKAYSNCPNCGIDLTEFSELCENDEKQLAAIELADLASEKQLDMRRTK